MLCRTEFGKSDDNGWACALFNPAWQAGAELLAIEVGLVNRPAANADDGIDRAGRIQQGGELEQRVLLIHAVIQGATVRFAPAMLSVQPSGPIKGIIGQFATQLLADALDPLLMVGILGTAGQNAQFAAAA